MERPFSATERAHSYGMSRLLPSVLSRHEFAGPELIALVLDGEAYRVGSCVVPLDEPATPALRATSLALELPPRLIAERHTAAWVWGAQSEPPARHEVCADITARLRPALGTRLSVREVVILHEDIAVLGELAVTTPMRTAIDLARFVDTWSEDETLVIRELLANGGFNILDCARAMNRKPNLPNKRLALERFALC
jgi:hypothetical protein